MSAPSPDGGNEDRALSSADDRFWSVAGWGIIGALVIAFAATTVAHSADSPTRLGGDFPAFYGAGRIVLEGDVADLYDPDRQAAAQEDLIPSGSGHLRFAYPPPVAALYAPLATLPYKVAYVIQSALMAGALVASFWLIRDLLPRRRPPGVVIAAVTGTYLPIAGAVALGQNIALVVLSYSAAWRLAHDRRDLVAGLALGMAFFKPQYAIPLLGLFLVRRRWRVVVGALAAGAAWWAAGTIMLGPSWPLEWIQAALEFSSVDSAANGSASVSWLGMARQAMGIGDPTALAIGLLLALGTAATLVWVWARDANAGLELPLAAAAAGVLLISPHSIVMDAGLLVLTVAGLAVAGGTARLTLFVATIWLLGAAHVLMSTVGHTPTAVAVVLAFVVALRRWASSRAVVAASSPR